MTLTVTALILVGNAGATPDSNPRVDVARNLNRGLTRTPMRGTGWRLEAVAHRWKVSPYFIIGVSGKESSLGHAACYSNRRNIWGLNSCQRGRFTDITGDGRSEHVPFFRTWGHAYTFFARYVRARYPRARTPYDFHGYCECGVQTNWAPKVAWFMRSLFGVGMGVKYP